MADAWTGRVVGAIVLALALAAAGATSYAEETPEGAQQEPESEPMAGQEPAAEGDEPAAGEEREAVVDVIYVTAQKRQENIQEIPLAISTLDEEQIQTLAAGGMDVRFLSARVPSLVLESSFGRAFPRFYMRGLGNTDFDLNASQPVSLIYDEIVLENPVLKGMPIFDVERVEIARGPQGTLFGRNTPAGIVKFDTVKPGDVRDAYLQTSYGRFDTLDVQGAVGGPLSDTVSARFSGLYQSRSDWVDNGFTGEDDALEGYTTGAARLQFLWQPSDTFSGLLNLHAWDVDGTARLFRANIIRPGTDDLVAGFDPAEIFIDGLNSQDIEGRGGVLKLDWTLDGAVLSAITGYETLEMFSRGDIDGGFGAVFAPPSGPGFIPFPSESADGLPDLDQLTQEVRLVSTGDGRLGWLVGAFYFDESLTVDSFSFNTLAGNAQDGFAFQQQDAESWALFGSIDYRVTERWDLKAGLRFTTDEKDFSAERPDPTFQTPTVAPIRRNTDADFVSWDLAATYHVSDDVNVFGRVATSFRAPSIQGRILFCPDFEGGVNPATNCVSVADEEEILSTEVGVKSTLFDRRVRLNLTGYVYEVDGQQIVAVGGEFNTATLLNADATEGRGFELDLEIAPTSEWLITLGLSNNSTEIQDSDLAVTPCGGGCTVLDPIVNGLARVDGNSLPHAPEWIFNGIVDYRRPAGSGLIAGSVDWSYHDEKSFFLYESREFRSDAFELGARLGYVFPDARYEIALFGRNLTDEVIVRNGIDFNNLTGMINDPRIWGVEIVTRF
jgi:iron complex outermembrane receptor protein